MADRMQTSLPSRSPGEAAGEAKPETSLLALFDHLEDDLRLHTRHLVGHNHTMLMDLDDLAFGIAHIVDEIGELGGGVTAHGQDDRLDQLKRQLGDMKSLLRSVKESATASVQASERMGERIVTNLRRNRLGNRRTSERMPISMAAALVVQDRRIPARTGNLSSGGALVTACTSAISAIREGDAIGVEITGIGELKASVAAKSPRGIHLKILGGKGRGEAALERFIGQIGSYVSNTCDRLHDLATSNCPSVGDLDGVLAVLRGETSGILSLRITGAQGEVLGQACCKDGRPVDWPDASIMAWSENVPRILAPSRTVNDDRPLSPILIGMLLDEGCLPARHAMLAVDVSHLLRTIAAGQLAERREAHAAPVN